MSEGKVEQLGHSTIRHSSGRRFSAHRSHHGVLAVVPLGVETNHELLHPDDHSPIEQVQHVDQVDL